MVWHLMHAAVTLPLQLNHYKRMHRDQQCTQLQSTMQASSLTYFVSNEF
jgi:hypothetical protein